MFYHSELQLINTEQSMKEDVIFHPCGRKIAQFATFVRPCGQTIVGYFLSTEFLCSFLPRDAMLARY